MAASAESIRSLPIRIRTYPPRGSDSPSGNPCTQPELRSLGGHIGAREASVDQERRRRYVRRLVAGEEQGTLGDLARLGKAAHGHVYEAALRLLGILGVQLPQERRVDGPGAERVDAHPA